MSAQLDNLNTQVAAVQTAANTVLDIVKNNPAQVELDATNAGVDAASATLAAVAAELNAVAPAPVTTPTA